MSFCLFLFFFFDFLSLFVPFKTLKAISRNQCCLSPPPPSLHPTLLSKLHVQDNIHLHFSKSGWNRVTNQNICWAFWIYIPGSCPTLFCLKVGPHIGPLYRGCVAHLCDFTGTKGVIIMDVWPDATRWHLDEGEGETSVTSDGYPWHERTKGQREQTYHHHHHQQQYRHHHNELCGDFRSLLNNT